MEMQLVDNTTKYQKKYLEELEDKLKSTLREIFQIDSPNLNFGIYRIMAQKHEEIERFINNDLINAVDEEFKKYNASLRDEIIKEKEILMKKISEDIADDALTSSGIIQKYLGTKSADKLNQQWKDLCEKENSISMSDVQKAEVFAHLEEFFSRYYKDGDFISQRRYAHDGKYSIPYNGEEVLLHWANKDQYYIKSDSFLNDHGFSVGEYKIIFDIVDGESAIDEKDPKYLFTLSGEKNEVEYSEDSKTLILRFKRRILPEITDKNRDITEELVKLYPPDGDMDSLISYILAKKSIPSGLNALLKGIPNDDKRPEILKDHLTAFTKKNTSDFFIHKELGNFLNGELDFYIKNEVFRLDDIGAIAESSLKLLIGRARIIKSIGIKIIAFLSQLEDLQKLLWEKKKFVLKSNYCITIDYIPEEFYEEICNNKYQISEWRKLYGLDKKDIYLDKSQSTLSIDTGNFIDKDFLLSHPQLMLDTVFFSREFNEKLLDSLIDSRTGNKISDLDSIIDGVLLHSDNWQALNLISEKYNHSIDCVYIDPPYNTDATPILYKNNYKDSTWLSLMADRLSLGNTFLKTDVGYYSIAIDDCELHNLYKLMEYCLPDKELQQVIVEHYPGSGTGRKNVSRTHEYNIFAIPNGADILRGEMKEGGRRERYFCRSGTGSNNLRSGRPNSFYAVLVDENTHEIKGFEKPPEKDAAYPTDKTNDGYLRVYPIGDNVERCWALSYTSVHDYFKQNLLYCTKNNVIKRLFNDEDDYELLKSIWTDDRSDKKDKKKQTNAENLKSKYSAVTQGTNLLSSLFNEIGKFPFPKSVYTVQTAIEAGTYNTLNPIVLDFFAGSGTTGHAIINLNRKLKGTSRKYKYILVEMGKHFNSVIKARLEKIIYSPSWSKGIPTSSNSIQIDNISQIFKYMEIEQYEDTLDNIEFNENGSRQTSLFTSTDYLLNYNLDFDTKDSPCRLNVKSMGTPFAYQLRTRRENGFEDIEKDQDGFRFVNVDLVETFNYLLGLHVLRIATRMNNGLKYRVVHGKTRDEKLVTIVWRNSPSDPEKHKKELEEDAEYIENIVLKEFECKELYVNGHCFAKNTKAIEPIFKKLMGA